MKRWSFFAGSSALALVTFGALAACGGSSSSSGSSSGASGSSGASDASIDTGRLKEPYRPEASCPVVIETPPLLDSPHVPETENPAYNSNPPSSGPHYPQWAQFQEFESPVPAGYLVHALEHGAVVLLYKCEGAACDPIKANLRKVRDAVPADPRCDPTIRARVIIAPMPTLDVPVAAAAWGWTYKAQCFDQPTLEAFAKTHYAQGPEDLCVPGKSTFGE